jgi:hypothetical protein
VLSRGSGWLACFVVEGCATPINLAGSWGAVDAMRTLGCWAEGVCLVRRAGCATTLSSVLRTLRLDGRARTKPGRRCEAFGLR